MLAPQMFGLTISDSAAAGAVALRDRFGRTIFDDLRNEKLLVSLALRDHLGYSGVIARLARGLRLLGFESLLMGSYFACRPP